MADKSQKKVKNTKKPAQKSLQEKRKIKEEKRKNK